jgi:major intracellular serine protease
MKNFVAGSTSIDDEKGHGSHCAGLIASRNFQHAVGIAKSCRLYVGKITDTLHNPSVPVMLEAIRWAAGLDTDGPQDVDIISMSCGSLLNMPDMKPVIDQAISKGKIMVFSIGNRDPESLPAGGNFPALFDNVISVGAVDFENQFQNYSYQSPNLTIACPGSNIVSYWLGGATHFETGTSQSAAVCAGVIALLVSKLKKRGETNIQKKISDILLTSSTKTTNGFTYRFLEPFKLYQSL